MSSSSSSYSHSHTLFLAAKKVKANLIQNAKIKARFYKGQRRGGVDQQESGRERERDSGWNIRSRRAGSSTHDSGEQNQVSGTTASSNTSSNALGRFARENGTEEEEDAIGSSSSSSNTGRARQRRPRKDEQHAGDHGDDDGNRRRRRDRAGPPPLPATSTQPTSRSQAQPQPRYSSREEAQEARLKRQAKWNTTSRSRHGAKRGQPDLGARMDVLLDKIQRDQS